MRKLIITIALLALMAVLVSACGPSAPPATKSPTAAPPAPTAPAATTAPATPAPVPTTPAAAQPKSGGTLKFWLLSTPAGFDSHRRPSYGPIITLPVFSNLVRFDPSKNSSLPNNLVGDLAKKWTWNAAGTECTFNLETGVSWHDGKPFSADDVVYSIEKLMDPKRSGMAGNFPTFQGITKVDNATVRITLKSPSPSLLVQLAHGYCPIEAKHLADVDWRSTDFLVGTGPFKFKTAAPGVSYELVKNPNYFRKDAAGKQLPYLDGVIINIMPDRNASASAVATGRLDMSSPLTGVATLEIYNQLKSLNKDLVFQTANGSYGAMYFFNCETPGPLTDARVRKALTLLTDGKEQIEAVYGSTMFADPTTGIMPPFYALPKDQIASLLGRDIPFDQRVTQAKKLMADAGYAGGFKSNILTLALPESIRTAQMMADYFKRYLNVETEVLAKPPVEFMQMRQAKQYQIVGDQPVSQLGEPNDLMPLFLTGSPVNYYGYKNAEADKLWQEQSTTLDVTKRRQLTAQIEKILLTDAMVAPQGFLRTTTVLQPYVKGFVAFDAAYCANMSWEVVWLDK